MNGSRAPAVRGPGAATAFEVVAKDTEGFEKIKLDKDWGYACDIALIPGHREYG